MELGTLADQLRRVTVEVTGPGAAVGAGVVWAPEVVVTAAHVIQQPHVLVRCADGRQVNGYVAAWDRHADLAVVRAPSLALPEARSADSEPIRVGSLVVAIGHPFGLRGALTTGIVHAIGPIRPDGRSWIQADLRLAPGNSGGPLADAQGRLLGLNVMIVQGLAFAIPVSVVRRFVTTARAPSP